MGASIPLPLACKASALPFELIPRRCEQDLNLRGQSPIDFKSISLTARTSQPPHLSSLHRGLNSRPSDYKSDALPLCYRGNRTSITLIITKPFNKKLKASSGLEPELQASKAHVLTIRR